MPIILYYCRGYYSPGNNLIYNQKLSALKKFTFLAYASILLISFYPARAQKISRQNQADQFSRCGTMERLEKYFQLNPQARAQAEQNQRMISNGPSINARTYRTTVIVNVPVVVHVVVPNPNIVTDADVQWVINKMNEDYAGVNADSTNESPAFMAVRGHSQIRFCLASRTPSGALTNGIDRVASNTQSNIAWLLIQLNALQAAEPMCGILHPI